MHLGSITAAFNQIALRNVCQPTYASSGKPDLQLPVQDAFWRLDLYNHPLNNANFGFWQAIKADDFYFRWRVLHLEFMSGSFGFVDGRGGAGRTRAGNYGALLFAAKFLARNARMILPMLVATQGATKFCGSTGPNG